MVPVSFAEAVAAYKSLVPTATDDEAELVIAERYAALADDTPVVRPPKFDVLPETVEILTRNHAPRTGKVRVLDASRSPAGELFAQEARDRARTEGERYRYLAHHAGGHWHD